MSHVFRPATSYDVAVGATSAASANPVPQGIQVVRLVATTACYVTFGAAPTAAKPGGFRLAPNWPENFRITGGEKVAVIEDAAAGTLTITEMAG